MSKPVLIFAIAGLLVPFAANPAAADLVLHDGFETCWSRALTKPQFLELLRTTIDGRSGCIAPQSGNVSGIAYTVCATANGCGAGVPGCAVALQSGSFSGDFVAGAFSAPGSASDIAVPINAGIFGSCTVNIGAVTLDYALDYLMRVDGTDGVYTDEMLRPQVTITNYTNSNNCNPAIGGLIGGFVPEAIESAQQGAADAIEPDLRAETLGRAVCPLSAP